MFKKKQSRVFGNCPNVVITKQCDFVKGNTHRLRTIQI